MTAAELQAVVDAFAKADVTTLPARIDPTSLIPDIASDHLISTLAGISTLIGLPS